MGNVKTLAFWVVSALFSLGIGVAEAAVTPSLPVTVTNSFSQPVPVDGVVGISPGSTVGISGPVKSGDSTDVIHSGHVTFNNRLSTLTALQDLSQYKTVRLIIAGEGTSTMEARVYEVDVSTNTPIRILIDAFAVPGNLLGTIHYYDLPGRHFSVDILNNSVGVDQTYQFFLLGRRN